MKGLVSFFSRVIFDCELAKTVGLVRFLLMIGNTASINTKLAANVSSASNSYGKYPSKSCHKLFDSVVSSEKFKEVFEEHKRNKCLGWTPQTVALMLMTKSEHILLEFFQTTIQY